MTSRKDQLRELLSTGIAPAERVTARETHPGESGVSPPEDVVTGIAPTYVTGIGSRPPSGAVKAMGLSLGRLHDELAEAKAAAERLATSERVVELDPAAIEPAFVSDRLSEAGEGDEAFAALVESMRANGQQVPVLVRPHPEKDKAALGRFQAAYGHRRIAAARSLGRPVRAVVRALTDAELVVAQGKENTERRDLSFIERAFFASALMQRGFDRATVMNALSLHKAEMTRLLQVAEAVPEHIARAIGPAPKAGRPRWLALAELLKGEAARTKAMDEVTGETFRAASSDHRFQMLFNRLAKKPKRAAQPKPITSAAGTEIARFDPGKGRGALAFSPAAPEGFAAFVAAELPRLLAAFSAAKAK